MRWSALAAVAVRCAVVNALAPLSRGRISGTSRGSVVGLGGDLAALPSYPVFDPRGDELAGQRLETRFVKPSPDYLSLSLSLDICCPKSCAMYGTWPLCQSRTIVKKNI